MYSGRKNCLADLPGKCHRDTVTGHVPLGFMCVYAPLLLLPGQGATPWPAQRAALWSSCHQSVSEWWGTSCLWNSSVKASGSGTARVIGAVQKRCPLSLHTNARCHLAFCPQPHASQPAAPW